MTFVVHGSLALIAYSAELTASEKALTFLTDVVGLDMTKYNATLTNNRLEYPSDLGGLANEYVDYILDSDESVVDVGCVFINKTLAYCNLYVYKGSPLYAQSPTNVLDAAKGIIDRYQTYTGNSYIQVMRDMLDPVTELEPMTKTVGNVKLEISKNENGPYTYIEWVYTSNGIDFDRKRVRFSFQDGTFRSFSGLWNLYKIGSGSINVSEEEAISIARNATKDMPKLYGRVGNETIVLQPIVAEEPVETELMAGIREPLTLYPLWHIQLYFDKLYGNYYGVAVDIWADTGEISGTYGTGIMGGIPQEDSTEATTPPNETPTEPQIVIPTEPPTEEDPTVTSTEPPPEDSTLPPTEPLTVPPPEDSHDQTGPDPTLLLVAVPIVLVIIFIVVFHRRKKNEPLEPPT